MMVLASLKVVDPSTYSLVVPAFASHRRGFADDTDGLAGEEKELAKLVERLAKASTAYGMEISAEKTKLKTTSVASTHRST